MKVIDLIKELQKHDPNLEVTSYNGMNSYKKIESIEICEVSYDSFLDKFCCSWNEQKDKSELFKIISIDI